MKQHLSSTSGIYHENIVCFPGSLALPGGGGSCSSGSNSSSSRYRIHRGRVIENKRLYPVSQCPTRPVVHGCTISGANKDTTVSTTSMGDHGEGHQEVMVWARGIFTSIDVPLAGVVIRLS